MTAGTTVYFEDSICNFFSIIFGITTSMKNSKSRVWHCIQKQENITTCTIRHCLRGLKIKQRCLLGHLSPIQRSRHCSSACKNCYNSKGVKVSITPYLMPSSLLRSAHRAVHSFDTFLSNAYRCWWRSLYSVMLAIHCCSDGFNVFMGGKPAEGVPLPAVPNHTAKIMFCLR